MKITIVTGSNQYYFKSLCQFLDNIYNTLYNYNIIVYVYNLGLDINTSNNLINILDNYNKNNNKISFINIIFDYSKYPSYYNINEKKGEYAWKSACIWETFNKINSGILMWCDSANLFTSSSIDSLLNIIKKQGIYSPSSKHTVKEWTHYKCLEYFNNIDTKKILNLQQRSGGMLCFDTDNVKSHNIIVSFYELSKIKECIAPQGSNILNHRQDQSLFTILYYDYTNMKELENECICFELHQYKHKSYENSDETSDENEIFTLNKCSLNTWKDIIKPIEQLIIHSVDPEDNDYFTLTSIGYNYKFLSLINNLEDSENNILKYQYGTHSETVLCCFDENLLINAKNNNINPYTILNNLKINGIINKKLTIEEYYLELPKYKYIIIPELDNIDNHLYYEALISGCIPIIIESKNSYMLSYKYDNVPFLYTKDYSDINNEKLNKIYDYFSNKIYNYSRLLLHGLNDTDYNDSLERTNKMFQYLQNKNINM